MGLKQVFTGAGATPAMKTATLSYYLTFSGTSFSAQLQVRYPGTPDADWLAVGAAITAQSTTPVFVGKGAEEQVPLEWRFNVTDVTTGTLNVYMG